MQCKNCVNFERVGVGGTGRDRCRSKDVVPGGAGRCWITGAWPICQGKFFEAKPGAPKPAPAPKKKRAAKQ